MNNRPIGVIDSGVGGLTVVKEIIRQLPHETIYYLGDVSRCPYGPRPLEEVLQFTTEMADYLVVEKDIKMLVIACNTATAAALDVLKKRLKIPVIGVVEPGARTAIMTTENNEVLVLATKGTIESNAYPEAIYSINHLIHVEGLACPDFVPLVEEMKHKDEVYAKEVIGRTLNAVADSKSDTVILGCTHYPLIQKYIEDYFPNKKIISSGLETGREVSAILTFNNSHASIDNQAPHHFYVNGDTEQFKIILSDWLHKDLLYTERIQLGGSV